MDTPQHWLQRRLFPVFFFLLIVNLLALDLLIGKNLLIKTDQKVNQAVILPTVLPTVIPAPLTQVDSQSCSTSCLTAINKAITSLKLTSSPTPQPKTRPTLQPTTIPVFQPTSSSQKLDSVKEFFIPLGSGSSTAADWSDVPGVKAEIDNTKYGTIQKILFEASVHVPNANEIVEVRLYNETDKYVVSNSDFLFPSGTTQNFRIAEIQLGQGAKIYKVQMKTQLQYAAILDQARIHITTY